MKNFMNRPLGPSQTIALDYIKANPGVNTAEVDRARRTARGGHQYMYETVDRLIRRGLVVRGRATSGRGVGLYAVEGV